MLGYSTHACCVAYLYGLAEMDSLMDERRGATARG